MDFVEHFSISQLIGQSDRVCSYYYVCYSELRFCLVRDDDCNLNNCKEPMLQREQGLHVFRAESNMSKLEKHKLGVLCTSTMG